MRSLLRALLEYVEESLKPAEGGLIDTGSDNVGKQVDSPPSEGENPDVSGMLVVGMGRTEFRMMRRAAGLTMAETAHLLGVTERTILRWEHGNSRIDNFKAAMIRAELMPGRWAKFEEKDRLSGHDEDDGPSDA